MKNLLAYIRFGGTAYIMVYCIIVNKTQIAIKRGNARDTVGERVWTIGEAIGHVCLIALFTDCHHPFRRQRLSALCFVATGQ